MHFPWKTAAAVGVGMTGLALIWREPSLPRIPAPPPAANPAEAEARLRALDAAYGGPVLYLCRHRVWRGRR